MKNPLFKPTTITAKLLVFLGVIAGYFLLAHGGLELATFNQYAGPVWPASGFGIGAILFFGPQVAPAIFLGGAIAGAMAQTPIFASLGMASGNMLEALLGCYLLRSVIERNLFNSYSEFIAISVASIFSSALSATLGICALYFAKGIPVTNIAQVWYAWWSGDVLGILIILPFMLVIYHKCFDWKMTWKNHIYGLLILMLMSTGLYLVFVKGYNQAFVWTLTPLLLISGVKLGNFFSRVLNIFLCFYLFYLTSKGYGPFEQGHIHRNLLYVQSLIASYSIAVLFVSPLKINFHIPARYLAGIISSWISVFIAIYAITAYEKKKTLLDFERTAMSSIQSIKSMARQYDLLLEGVSALLSVNPDFTDSDWERFLTSVHPQRYSDFINSLGVLKVVEKNKIKEFESTFETEVKLIDPKYANLNPSLNLLTKS